MNHKIERKVLKIRLFSLLLFAALLSACGGTGRYIEKPSLNVVGQVMPTSEALNSLFSENGRSYNIQLCEADMLSKECVEDDGISARGIGGIFLPLYLDMTGIEVLHTQRIDSRIAMAVRLNAKINSIAPLCGTVSGTVTSENDSALLSLSNFYCNWAGIGNVITNVDLSIDSIDTAKKTFTGFYRISFYGTGNATGSGVFKAAIIPSSNFRSSHEDI